MDDVNYKVLITTSGTGSRLSELTKYINKALVKIGNKPAISYIIEAYPKEVPLVVTIGYLAEQVKEFLLMAYPDRKFEFVQVYNYEGPGTSLGLSMLQAEQNLQCPFIFHCCDTIVTEDIPEPTKNWIGGYVMNKEITELPWSQYRTHKVVDGKVVRLNEKGDPDFESAHVGLVGINDYASFWKTLREIYEADKENICHSDVHVIAKMIKSGINFELAPYQTWLDTGNMDSLERAKNYFSKDSFIVLEKAEQSIYFFDDFVIKFFADEELLNNRVRRGEILKNLVPETEEVGKNFYKYKFIKGDLFADVANEENITDFLQWAKSNLWQEVKEVGDDKFKDACREFYYNKTKERLQNLFASNTVEDKVDIINGEEIPSIYELLEKVDFDWLTNSKQTNFHGDLVLDNVLKTEGGWCLLDWRQDFGGLLQAGDMYYDLAKFNHNLTVNHDIIDQDKFTLDIMEDKINIDIERKDNLVASQKSFFKYLKNNGHDVSKVRILTAIIWLNMSPLHHNPFNKFLFYLGKLNLWKELNQNK
mgnify:CR=1 FL=1|jgi:choline kinase